MLETCVAKTTYFIRTFSNRKLYIKVIGWNLKTAFSCLWTFFLSGPSLKDGEEMQNYPSNTCVKKLLNNPAGDMWQTIFNHIISSNNTINSYKMQSATYWFSVKIGTSSRYTPIIVGLSEVRKTWKKTG